MIHPDRTQKTQAKKSKSNFGVWTAIGRQHLLAENRHRHQRSGTVHFEPFVAGPAGGRFRRRLRTSKPVSANDTPDWPICEQEKKFIVLGSCGSMKWNIVVGSLMLGACLSTPSFGGGLLDRMLGLHGSGCDSACCDTGCSADPSCGCELSSCGGCADACGGCSAAPTCGCEMAACEPSCGCETACADPCGCGAGPTCGCEMAACGGGAPSCGCEVSACDPCGCTKARRKPLLELLSKLEHKKRSLFGGRSNCDSCCDNGCSAEPACGCEMAACGCADACAPSCGCEITSCDPCGGCDSGCGRSKGAGLLGKLFKRKNNSCCDSGCGAAPTCGCEVSCCSSGSAPSAAPAASGDAAPAPPAPIVDPSAYLQNTRRVIQATSYSR